MDKLRKRCNDENKTLYTCEICHTNYSDKNMAKDCEKHHKKEVGIVDKRKKGGSRDMKIKLFLKIKKNDDVADRIKTQVWHIVNHNNIANDTETYRYLKNKGFL